MGMVVLAVTLVKIKVNFVEDRCGRMLFNTSHRDVVIRSYNI